MTTRITNDINQVETTVNSVLRLLLRSPVVVIGAMIMAFTIDLRAGFIFVGIIPVLMIIVFVIMKISSARYSKAGELLDNETRAVKENLSGVRVVRAFNLQDKANVSFRKENDSLFRAHRLAGRVSVLMNPLTFAVVNVGIIILLYISGIRVNVGALSQGEVVALINYISQILTELIKAASLVVLVSKGVASAKRIDEVFAAEPEKSGKITGCDTFTDTYLEFDNVSYMYEEAHGNALEGVSFTAQRGEKIGIIGGTGSGKTTLVNLIPKLFEATSGDVRFCGVNVRERDTDDLRERIAFVPQKSVLFGGSIRENICYGKPDASEEEINEALRAAQAFDFVSEKPEGLETKVERGGVNFSGGQRQRLSIARALVRRPEILILDDASSALDLATDAALRKALTEYAKDMTVFTVSQRAAGVMECDKIIVLDEGRVSGVGRHKELLAGNEVYRDICRSQGIR